MACDEFQTWLNLKLKQLKIDESVFGSYIISILEEEDEKYSALEGLFQELMEKDADKYINEILDKWNTLNPTTESTNAVNNKPSVDIDVQLAKILQTKVTTSTTNQRQYTAEEKKIKEAILAQYSQCSDKEEEDEEEDTEVDPDMVKNTNKADVQALIKEKREQAKLDSKLKKEKDREDREKQRQLRDEKKEKRKTVKQERKR